MNANIQFIQYTPEQLQSEISNGVKVQLQEFLKHFKAVQPVEYLTRQQVAKIFNVDLSTIYNWQKSEKLKPLGLDSKVYFSRTDIEACLAHLNQQAIKSNNTNHCSANIIKRTRKHRLSTTQLITVFEYLQKQTATASMIAEATGIPQKSICRYKRLLEKSGLLYQVEKKHCKLTNHSAWYLTTKPELFLKSNQLKLF